MADQKRREASKFRHVSKGKGTIFAQNQIARAVEHGPGVDEVERMDSKKTDYARPITIMRPLYAAAKRSSDRRAPACSSVRRPDGLLT